MSLVSQTKQDAYSLSNGDIALCAGNVLGFASDYVLMTNKINNPMELLTGSPSELAVFGAALGTSIIANLVSSMGESVASVRSFSDIQALAPAALLTAAKVVVGQKMLSQPILSPLLLAMNVQGTYAVVKRAFTELSKCWDLARSSKEGHSLLVARNALVHTINGTSSIYRTWNIFNYCKEYFFPGMSNEVSGSLRGSGGISETLTPEQKMDRVIELAEETEESGKLLCNVCTPACAPGISQADVNAAKKQCRSSLLLEVHQDKFNGNPFLEEKANRASVILNDALARRSNGPTVATDPMNVVSDFLARADKAEKFFDSKNSRFVPSPIIVLDDLYRSIESGQQQGTVKYPYQIRRLIDEHISLLIDQFERARTSEDETLKAMEATAIAQHSAELLKDILGCSGKAWV